MNYRLVRFPLFAILLCLGLTPIARTADALTDADALEAIDIVRRRLKNPERRFDVDDLESRRLRLADESDVIVTVYADQAPPMSVRASEGSLGASVASAADTLIGAPAALFYALDKSDELAVLIEVGSRPRQIWPVDPRNPREMGAFELGVDALRLVARTLKGAQTEAYLPPSTTVTNAESDPEETMENLGGQVAIGSTPERGMITLKKFEHWRPDTVRLYADRMVQFAQRRAGAPLLWTCRLSAPVTRVDERAIERTLKRGVTFLASMQAREGHLVEKYGPTLRGIQTPENPLALSQARALIGISRYWELTRDAAARTVATRLASALAELAESMGERAYFRRDEKTPPDTSWTAECALALARSPSANEHRELLEKLGAFLLSMQEADGRIHQGYSMLLNRPLPTRTSEIGVAALALAELGHRLRRDDFSKAARTSAEWLRIRRLRDLKAGKLSLGREEEFELFERMALTDKAYLELLDPVAGMLAKVQFTGENAPYPDYIGTFRKPSRIGGFDIGARHAANCIRVLWAATQARKRAGRDVAAETQALARAARFLMQLQIEKDEAFYCPNPGAAHGLLRQDLVDPDMLLRDMGVSLTGLSHAMEAVGNRRYEFPAAKAPR